MLRRHSVGFAIRSLFTENRSYLRNCVASYRHAFESFAADDQKTTQMGAEQESFRQPAQGAERGLEGEDIGHERALIPGLEEVIMLKKSECALGHSVLEECIGLKRRNFAGEPLGDAEMFAFPGDFFAEFEEARSATGDYALAGVCC
jgi:hypothetical protein